MAEVSALTQLYLKISDSLSEEDVRDLRAILVPDVLSQGRVEQATPLEMFNMLEADNKIGKGNLGLLVEILTCLGRAKLADEAECLEQEQRREGQGEAAIAASKQTVPMSGAHRTLLLRNYPTIYLELDATRVLDYLHQQGVLTDEMRQEILAIPEDQRHNRTRRLLDLILQMGDNAFAIFRTALGHAGYQHLMELLTGEQQHMPPMPMALAIDIYSGSQGKEDFNVHIKEQPHVIIPNEQLLTTIYQKDQILQLKTKMKDDELRALNIYEEKQVELLEGAKANLSQESLEKKFDELQAKVEEQHAIIIRTYRGCVILFLTFESEPKFAHFWGSYSSGDLSTTLSELLMTEEMRSLEGEDQLVLKTMVLEQDYRAWRDFFGKDDPQLPEEEQVEQVTSQLAALGTFGQQRRKAGSIRSIASARSAASTMSSGSVLSSDSGYTSTGSQMTLSEGENSFV
uniref:CARD domain-containing protein n=1 Tax=Branchiostoma floridae TaxID=7739 RepID=C3YMI4_BRAFL|eukprot:XP_002602468.1 hypothetical protein BRAFLDRAFT_86852 [Branchiostoma floridae]